MQTSVWSRINIFKNRTAVEAFFLLLLGFSGILIAALFVFTNYLNYSHFHLGREKYAHAFVKIITVARALPDDHLKRQLPLLQEHGFFIKIAKSSESNSIIIKKQSLTDLQKIAQNNYPHMLVSLQLSSDKWLIIQSLVQEHPWLWSGMITSSLVLFLALIALCIFVVNYLAIPSVQFIEAARRFSMDIQAAPMPVTGPNEIQKIILAFNEMQNQIRRLITDRTQMLAAISHDLRTPITRLQLRLESAQDSPQYEKMMADITEMEQMINSILSFARDYIRAEPIELLDLNALVETICNNLTDAGFRVNFHGTDARLPFYGRLTALKRAIGNIIENSVKYGDSAEVQVQKIGEIIQINISDVGPGIPEHEMENVFAPFYRIDKARTGQKGSGLGLAVARDIIRAHGGDISLINRQPKGLTVTILLKSSKEME